MSIAEALATQTNENALPRWKRLLNAVRQMQAKTGVELWKRTKMVLEVYYDQEFRDSVHGRLGCAPDETDWEKFLDPFVEDVFLGYDRSQIQSPFRVLKAVYEEFPQRNHWQRNTLAKLLRMHWDKRSKPVDQKPPRKQAVAKIDKAEYARLQQRYQEALVRNEELSRKLEQPELPPVPRSESNGTNGHSQPPFPHPNGNGQVKRPVVEREPYEPRKDYSRGVAEANPVGKPVDDVEAFRRDASDYIRNLRKLHPRLSLEQASSEFAQLLIKLWK